MFTICRYNNAWNGFRTAPKGIKSGARPNLKLCTTEPSVFACLLVHRWIDIPDEPKSPNQNSFPSHPIPSHPSIHPCTHAIINTPLPTPYRSSYARRCFPTQQTLGAQWPTRTHTHAHTLSSCSQISAEAPICPYVCSFVRLFARSLTRSLTD